MGEDIPRIRKLPLGSESLLVVRGWGDGAAAIHADACRFRERFSKWGRYGLSAFAIAEAAELSALMEWRLERFAVVRVFRREALEEVGIDVVPTFRRPHVTLAHVRFGALLTALTECDHEDVTNPHHTGEE